MAFFQLLNCDIGLTIRDVNYDFEDLDVAEQEDPRQINLKRGAIGKSTSGIPYGEGWGDPMVHTFTLVNIPSALLTLLREIFNKKGIERLSGYIIDRNTGSSRTIKKAVLGAEPKQLSIGEGADSLNIQVVLRSYVSEEKHKDAVEQAV